MSRKSNEGGYSNHPESPDLDLPTGQHLDQAGDMPTPPCQQSADRLATRQASLRVLQEATARRLQATPEDVLYLQMLQGNDPQTPRRLQATPEDVLYLEMLQADEPQSDPSSEDPTPDEASELSSNPSTPSPTDTEIDETIRAFGRAFNQLRQLGHAVHEAAGDRLGTDRQMQYRFSSRFSIITTSVPRSPVVARPPREPLPTRIAAAESEDCWICLDATQHTEVADLPCGHWFHTKCVNKWLDEHSENMTCPMCRAELK